MSRPLFMVSGKVWGTSGGDFCFQKIMVILGCEKVLIMLVLIRFSEITLGLPEGYLDLPRGCLGPMDRPEKWKC